MISTIVALYRGRTIADAKLVGVTVDPAIAAAVAGQMLDEKRAGDDDPIVAARDDGQRKVLQLVKAEAEQDAAQGRTTRDLVHIQKAARGQVPGGERGTRVGADPTRPPRR